MPTQDRAPAFGQAVQVTPARWGEERRLLEYSSISRRRKKAVRRRREALFSELTGGHLQGRYKSNLYTYGLPPGVIKDNRAEKKLEEEPQAEDSCSQATTGGFTRAAALDGTDSEVKKIKKTNRDTAYVNWRIFGGE